MFMRIKITTQNSKMAFDLRPDEIELLVQTAFQYAAGSHQYQEKLKPGLEVQLEDGCKKYAKDEEYVKKGASRLEEDKADAPVLPESLAAQEMPEKFEISEEPGEGDVTAGIDGDTDGLMEREQQEQLQQDSIQEDLEQPTDTSVMREHRPWKYKGFLLIKCQHCGKLKGFCAKTQIDMYICDCGVKTPIQNLVHATASCKCGKKWLYRTNADDQMIEVDCIQCGSPIDLVWNARRGMYVTLQDRN